MTRITNWIVAIVAHLWARVTARLLPEWRSWWRAWSMRLAAVAAVIITYLSAAPDALSAALNALPSDIRATLPAWIGPAVFLLLFVARYWDQRKEAGGA